MTYEYAAVNVMISAIEDFEFASDQGIDWACRYESDSWEVFKSFIAFEEHSCCIIGAAAGFEDVFAVLFAPDPEVEIGFEPASECICLEQLEDIVALGVFEEFVIGDFDQCAVPAKESLTLSQNRESCLRTLCKRD